MIRHTRAVRLPLSALVASLLFLPGPVQSQEAAGEDEGWTPALSMEYHPVMGTDLSPDGELVAYVLRKPLMDGEKSEFLSHIWLASSNGGVPRQFTRGDHSASSPAFSPNGRFLAFTSDRSGDNQLWAIPLAGGEAFQISDEEPGVGAFQWSPDGETIVFTMVDPATEEEELAEKEKRDVILVDRNFKYSHLYRIPFDPDDDEIPEAERLTEGEFNVTAFDITPDGSAARKARS